MLEIDVIDRQVVKGGYWLNQVMWWESNLRPHKVKNLKKSQGIPTNEDKLSAEDSPTPLRPKQSHRAFGRRRPKSVQPLLVAGEA